MYNSKATRHSSFGTDDSSSRSNPNFQRSSPDHDGAQLTPASETAPYSYQKAMPKLTASADPLLLVAPRSYGDEQSRKDRPTCSSFQKGKQPDSNNDDEQEDWDQVLDAKKYSLLARSERFHIPFDPDRGYRGTALRYTSFARPHMRAFHASWICFFTSFFVQFSPAPLLPEIQRSLSLSRSDVWWTNACMMMGGIPMRFLLGPLCDQYGARTVMVTTVALVALPSALTGVVAVNLTSLTLIRTVLGAMDSFVPGQYWITCQFVREVGGTAMALAGGLGATGAGVTQLVTGSLVFPALRVWFDGDSDLAWRWSLVIPAILALFVAAFFYEFSDDCPLGNFTEVKQAGLMMERSAVDSFRAGVYNLNSWILFVQYAGSCGVDFTMCNGTALYFHYRFKQSIAASGAIAFLYGLSAIFARGAGGWLSDAAFNRFSLRGRLWAQWICMVTQGILNVWFARTDRLGSSLTIMVLFSILIQMSMGTCYSIVPYVDGPNTGSVAGIVGAGGNVGGAIFAVIFMHADYHGTAMELMGWLTCVTACFSPFLAVRGYRGILFGTEDSPESDRHKQHSPLLVPGKFAHSPHLVSLARRQYQRQSLQQR